MEPSTWIRLLLHIILTALLTTKVVIWNNVDADYHRTFSQTFFYLFGTPAMKQSSMNNQLYTYNETIASLENVIETYMNINNYSTALYQFGQRRNGFECSVEPPPIIATTTYYTDATHEESYEVAVVGVDDLTFITQDTKSYFYNLKSINLQFDLCNIMYDTNECNYWKLSVEYQFIAQLYLQVMISSKLDPSCSSDNRQYTTYLQNPFFSVELVIIIFAISYLILCIQDVHTAIRLYFDVKTAHEKARQAFIKKHTSTSIACAQFSLHEKQLADIAVQYRWEEIPTGIKRNFHSNWSIITIIGIACAISDAIFTLTMHDNRYASASIMGKLFLGFGSLFFWASAVQFLSPFPALYAISNALQTVIPRILAFAVGFIPIYMAFVILGMGLFGGRLGMFHSLAKASSSMFALSNGDSVEPILLLMGTRAYLACILYGMVFILLHAYLMYNILIAIVEEAYFLSRNKSRALEFLMWKNLSGTVLEQHKKQNDIINSSSIHDPTSSHGGAAATATAEQEEADMDALINQQLALELSRSRQQKEFLDSLDQKEQEAEEQQLDHSEEHVHQQEDEENGNNHHDEEDDDNDERRQRKKRKNSFFGDEEEEEWVKKVFTNAANSNITNTNDHNNLQPNEKAFQSIDHTPLQQQQPIRSQLNSNSWQPDDLHITLAEEAAEVYILGQSHWEYSKLMDHIVEFLSK